MRLYIISILSACFLVVASASASDDADLLKEWRGYIDPFLTMPDRLSANLKNKEDALQRHELYEFIFSQISAGYVMLFYADPESPDWWPNFSHVNDILWPNPDTIYWATPIDSSGVYKLSGQRGTVKMVDVQPGGGEFVTRGEHAGVGGGMGPAIRSFDVDDLEVGEDGSFEVILSLERPNGYQGDWWELDPKSTYLFVRQVAYDWENEVNASVAIERLDRPVNRPRSNLQNLKDNLNQIAIWTENWINVAYQLAGNVRDRDLVNEFGFVEWGASGLTSQQYVVSAFDLDDDEALIIETEIPEKCRYWSFQLVTDNWRAINGLRHQSSLNGHQAQLDQDGKFRAVISITDPGVPNWLDPAGHGSAMVYGRWNQCSSDPLPVATKVKLAEVRNYLPDETPLVSEEVRDQVLRDRKRAGQLRRRW